MGTRDFFNGMATAHKGEYIFLALNALAALPFLGSWWMTIPQLMWFVVKMVRLVAGSHKIEERDVFKKEVYEAHRKWHIMGLFFYLISWFIYFARMIMAI